MTALTNQFFANHRGYWFDGLLLELNGSGTNTIIENWENWRGPPVYHYQSNELLFPSIEDNTEGIGGFNDLIIQDRNRILLDIGGGKHDAAKWWMLNKYPHLTFYTVDPYFRSKEHNEEIQNIIENIGGADIVTSMSVLNVIEDRKPRLRHCSNVYDALKPKGIAYFKIWAGWWPDRGSSVAFRNIEEDIFQSNSWAHTFKSDVESAFGQGNVFVEDNKNLIIAIKR